MIEVAGSHFERLEDVLVDVDLEVIAAQPLDDLTEKDIAEIGVAPTAARGEGDVGVGEHRFNLRPFGGLEGLPVAVGGVVAIPGPGRIAETGAVGEQVADCDGVNRAVGVVYLAEFGI